MNSNVPKLRYKGFEENSNVKPINEITNISTYSSKSKNIEVGGLYSIVDMGSINIDGTLRISKFTNINKDFLSYGDIIMPKDCMANGKLIGSAAIIPRPSNLNEAYIGSDHIFILRSKENIDSKFLYFSINKNKRLFQKNAVGTPVVGLSKSNLEKLKLSLPSYDEQIKIANLLTKINELINVKQKEIELLKIKQEYLFGKMLATSKNFRYLSFMNKQNIASVKLKDVVTVNQGLQIAISNRKFDKSENNMFYITNEILKNNGIKYYIENASDSVKCDCNDILMTRTGNTGIVVTDVEGVFHNNFFKIHYNSYFDKDFLVMILRSKSVQRNILKLAGISTIPDLNHNDFYSLKVPFTELHEQEKISLCFKKQENLIMNMQKELEMVKSIKIYLLQNLLV